LVRKPKFLQLGDPLKKLTIYGGNSNWGIPSQSGDWRATWGPRIICAPEHDPFVTGAQPLNGTLRSGGEPHKSTLFVNCEVMPKRPAEKTCRPSLRKIIFQPGHHYAPLVNPLRGALSQSP